MFLGIIVCIAFAVIAIVDSGRRQAFATGFVAAIVVYTAVFFLTPGNELDPYEGKLPTTMLLRPLFEATTKQTWTDLVTGEELPDYVPTPAISAARGGTITEPGTGGIPVVRSVGLSESPNRAQFMSIGHIFWAALFGYLVGKFALHVFGRRNTGDGRGAK